MSTKVKEYVPSEGNLFHQYPFHRGQKGPFNYFSFWFLWPGLSIKLKYQIMFQKNRFLGELFSMAIYLHSSTNLLKLPVTIYKVVFWPKKNFVHRLLKTDQNVKLTCYSTNVGFSFWICLKENTYHGLVDYLISSRKG